MIPLLDERDVVLALGVLVVLQVSGAVDLVSIAADLAGNALWPF